MGREGGGREEEISTMEICHVLTGNPECFTDVAIGCQVAQIMYWVFSLVQAFLTGLYAVG